MKWAFLENWQIRGFRVVGAKRAKFCLIKGCEFNPHGSILSLKSVYVYIYGSVPVN